MKFNFEVYGVRYFYPDSYSVQYRIFVSIIKNLPAKYKAAYLLKRAETNSFSRAFLCRMLSVISNSYDLLIRPVADVI
jgi:hypothetical protein